MASRSRDQTRQIGTNSGAGGSPRPAAVVLGELPAPVLQGQWKRDGNWSLSGRRAAHRRHRSLPHCPASPSTGRGAQASAPAIPSGLQALRSTTRHQLLEPWRAPCFLGARSPLPAHFPPPGAHSWPKRRRCQGLPPKPGRRSRCPSAVRAAQPASRETGPAWHPLLLSSPRTAAHVGATIAEVIGE